MLIPDEVHGFVRADSNKPSLAAEAAFYEEVLRDWRRAAPLGAADRAASAADDGVVAAA